MAIFDKNKRHLSEKMGSVETVIYFCGYSFLVLFIVFAVKKFFSTCKLDWILNFSSFLKYLAGALQTNIFISHPLETLN